MDAFQNEVRRFGTTGQGTQRVAANCWLLRLNSDTGTLAGVVAAAQQYGLEHRVLYFPEAPTEYSYSP